MPTHIDELNIKIKYLNKERGIRSISVEFMIHPLQLSRHQITSLDNLCNHTTKWMYIGHTMPAINNQGHSFVVYGQFFDHGMPYGGIKKSLQEAFDEMVLLIQPSFSILSQFPQF